MEVYARFPDGIGVSEKVFLTLAKFAPDGHLSVVAFDQGNSIKKLLRSFFANARAKSGNQEIYLKEPRDLNFTQISRVFAKTFAGIPNAGLFNDLGYLGPDFRELLGPKTMLIGRLENTNFLSTSDGQGWIPQLGVSPEDVVDRVDAFKTLVKINPWHRESWKASLDWLKDIYERCQKLGKPLFNETRYIPRNVSEIVLAKNLPNTLIEIARVFSPYGDFYKTQVPLLWVQEDGNIVKISSPRIIIETAEEMARVVNRPMLILSAAVDFEQYAAQYACVCDKAAGPMCGRAYWQDPFADPKVTNWYELQIALQKIAIPRMLQIQELARRISKPWWHKFTWLSDEAKDMIETS